MPQALTLDKKIIFVALASAIAVSLIYGLPYFLIKNQLAREGKVYSPITIFSDGDEAQIYAPFIKEAEEGDILLGDPALKKYDNAPSLMPPLGPFFLGFLAKTVGFNSVWILADFLFPALIFLIFFLLFYEIIGHAYVSLVLSGVFIFAREAASLIPFSTFQQFKAFAVYFKPYLSAAVENRLSFDRLLAPEWTFVPLGIFFLFWIISLEKRTIFLSVVTGFFLGVLFYSYPYDWISASMILGVNLMIQILIRNSRGIKFIFASAVTAFLISIPYWVSFSEVYQLPHYKELLNRTGLESGRMFRLFLTPHYILWIISASWLIFKRKDDSLSLFSASIFIASFIILNIHVITGYAPQPDHFLRYPLSFALVIAYAILARELWVKYNFWCHRYKTYFLSVLIIALAFAVTRSIQFQKAYAKDNAWRYSVEEPIYDSFRWLDGNTPEDSTVLSPSIITNTHLLIFTKSKVFVPSTGVITTASDRELVERFIIAAKVFGMNDADILKLFRQESLEKSRDSEEAEGLILTHLFHYSLYTQDINSSFKSKKFRDIRDIEKLALNAVNDFRENTGAMLNKYEFDYIYAGPVEKRLFSLNINNLANNGICLNEVYNQENISIYERCK